MQVTTFHTEAHLQVLFNELRTQLETVTIEKHIVTRRDNSTATMIRAERFTCGTVELSSLTASGYELRFAMNGKNQVTHYESDGFAIRLLEAWALEVLEEIAASTRKETPKARCPHYAQIKAFYGAATAAGLDTKNNEAARAAVNLLFHRALDASRETLAAWQWARATEAVKNGELAW